MNWNNLMEEFDSILSGVQSQAPYDNPEYIEYVKLNNSRTQRWLKRGELTDEIKTKLAQIQEKQEWILITEPWCGDAAHLAPFIQMMSEQSSKIDLKIQLRDGHDSEIDDYLTNGGKSIPKLVVRDKNGNDMFTWGPRPEGAAEMVFHHKSSEKTNEEKKAELQMWYNQDKGQSIQREIADLL